MAEGMGTGLEDLSSNTNSAMNFLPTIVLLLSARTGVGNPKCANASTQHHVDCQCFPKCKTAEKEKEETLERNGMSLSNVLPWEAY